jgi:ribosome biogenesis GTPase / thiamine phosphate phosphatase
MHPLAPFGWDDDWADATDALARPGDRPARVTLVRRVNCDVVTVGDDDRPRAVTARPSPRLAEVPDGASLPAVGDWVLLSDEEGTEDPAIVAICGRRSVISRRDPAEVTGEQVLAANVDVLGVVHALDRPLNVRSIERALVVAMQAGAQVVVTLTKCDVAGPDATRRAVATTRDRLAALDAEVLATSTVTGEGIDRLAALTRPGRTLALLGPSGAGKSSLLNALVGADAMAVGDVRAGDAKGRHTTVTRELVALPGGGAIIDTPGLRGLGLWEADLGVDLAFPEVMAAAEDCRFADCTHDREPGCAVGAAVEAGTVQGDRVAHYRQLVDELADMDERRTLQERERGERGPRSQGQRTGRRVTRRGRR